MKQKNGLDDLGNGWWLQRERFSTWTRYTILRLDAEGYQAERSEHYSRKRDAMEWHAKRVTH